MTKQVLSPHPATACPAIPPGSILPELPGRRRSPDRDAMGYLQQVSASPLGFMDVYGCLWMLLMDVCGIYISVAIYGC